MVGLTNTKQNNVLESSSMLNWNFKINSKVHFFLIRWHHVTVTKIIDYRAKFKIFYIKSLFTLMVKSKHNLYTLTVYLLSVCGYSGWPSSINNKQNKVLESSSMLNCNFKTNSNMHFFL